MEDFCGGFLTITTISELRCRYSALTVADIDEDNHLVLLLVVQHSYIIPDIIVQDGATFIDDANIFDSGYVAGLEQRFSVIFSGIRWYTQIKLTIVLILIFVVEPYIHFTKKDSKHLFNGGSLTINFDAWLESIWVER